MMGMYTEIYINCRLRKDTPAEVIEVLKYLVGERQMPANVPSDPFFSCDRWNVVLTCSSYYFVPYAVQKLTYDTIAGAHYLFARADLKNYDDEIEKFVAWLTPYIDANPGEHLGHKRYEEAIKPTLLYHPDTWVAAPDDMEGES